MPLDEAEKLDMAIKRESLGFGLMDNLIELGYSPKSAQEIADGAAAQDAQAATLAVQRLQAGQLGY